MKLAVVIRHSDNCGVPTNFRRLFVENLTPGRVSLDADEAHHAREVLRLKVREDVELFDLAGNVAQGTIDRCDPAQVTVRVTSIQTRAPSVPIVVAAAIPKGERADWMIEKLSELGVDRFIPLQAERSVVIPSGRNKRERWERIAIESAKQSRRPGIMLIDELTSLSTCTDRCTDQRCIYLSTEESVDPLAAVLESQKSNLESQVSLLIGPEGGWTDAEIARFASRNLTPARLTATILRVETAAIAAAATVASWRDHASPP